LLSGDPDRSHGSSRTPSRTQTGKSQPLFVTELQITIESLNARYRRAIRARGHFPTEQAALKCLYLVTRSLDPTGRGKARWAMRWKPALNAFAITFNGRITPTGN
jgi:transposase-like protein